MVAKGAFLDVSSPGRNALFGAVGESRVDIAKVLLEAGIDANVVYRSVTGKLKNALSYAQERGEKPIVELLEKAGCRFPIEGVDTPVWQPEHIHEPAPQDQAHDEIKAYMSRLFGTAEPLALQEIVPVHDKVHVAIHVIRPSDRHPFLTLFTTGMSDQPMNVPPGQESFQYAELIMQLPGEWPHPRELGRASDRLWPVEWLRQLAYFPHLNDTWLGGPTTIISSDEPPFPLGPDTDYTCLLLIADYEQCGPVNLEDGKIVRLYRVVPIRTEEREFEKQHGVVGLVRRLQSKAGQLF